MERHESIPPMHPGETLRDDILPRLGVSKTAFARALGISRQHLYNILNETHPVSPETAVRLGAALGNSPEFWLNLQSKHDLARARREVDVAGITPIAAE
jgi:addiction module HigA family antidote